MAFIYLGVGQRSIGGPVHDVKSKTGATGWDGAADESIEHRDLLGEVSCRRANRAFDLSGSHRFGYDDGEISRTRWEARKRREAHSATSNRIEVSEIHLDGDGVRTYVELLEDVRVKRSQ